MAFTRSGVRLPLAPPSSAVFGRLTSYEKFLTRAYACLEAHVALSDKKQATISKDTSSLLPAAHFQKAALKTKERGKHPCKARSRSRSISQSSLRLAIHRCSGRTSGRS